MRVKFYQKVATSTHLCKPLPKLREKFSAPYMPKALHQVSKLFINCQMCASFKIDYIHQIQLNIPYLWFKAVFN